MSRATTHSVKAPSRFGKLISTLEIFSSVMLAIMMVLTFVDVIGRYVFSKPVFGASEMISALLAFVVFSGLGIANARDRHIVVELFDDHIRRMAPRLYDGVIQGFSVLAMILIAYVLLEAAWESYRDSARNYSLGITNGTDHRNGVCTCSVKRHFTGCRDRP